MKYEVKNYEHLLGLAGFSDQLLKNHFILYSGYVAKFNKLNEILVKMEKSNLYDTSEFAELNRRFGWEFNGMRLHEYYFENLTKEQMGIAQFPSLSEKINQNWDSYEEWEKDFKAMGMMRGIGWVVLYYDIVADRLFNVWINEHDVGHFAGAKPLLVMDVFEHAFMVDYGLKKADCIEAFFKAIDWKVVSGRLS